ncbi:MAG: bacillithiol system redox-active protein YtxJ [Flavobacteriales bacterium]|nr:bacillithiol system redox-active protein YtxJ [Flavobacteriales bacterium]MCB9166250.1 bacillithiol system redox-active protein YtxJ [Flavobacteriales bacterium]
MHWEPLTGPAQLDTIDAASQKGPVLIFKHSTRCGISSTALDRLERGRSDKDDAHYPAFFLDLLRYREVSNMVAERYGARHESPQVLIIRHGRCVHHASHLEIDRVRTWEALMTADREQVDPR